MEIYRNSRSWRLRWLCLGFWGLVVFFAVGALVIHEAGADRGNDVDSWIDISLLFVVVSLPLDAYRRLYVTSITRVGDMLEVETLGLFRPTRHALPADALRLAHEGRYVARGDVSMAVKLPRPGRFFPFIVDTTEDRLEAGRGA